MKTLGAREELHLLYETDQYFVCEIYNQVCPGKKKKKRDPILIKTVIE